MTAILILNAVLMVTIVATILAVLAWGIVTDRPWREFLRQARSGTRRRPVTPSHSRAPARRRARQPSWSA